MDLFLIIITSLSVLQVIVIHLTLYLTDETYIRQREFPAALFVTAIMAIPVLGSCLYISLMLDETKRESIIPSRLESLKNIIYFLPVLSLLGLYFLM